MSLHNSYFVWNFNAYSKTVIVFVLVLIVFEFSSLKIEKKKHENHNFLRNYIENQKFSLTKSKFSPILHMPC